jgi:hypothetical protein
MESLTFFKVLMHNTDFFREMQENARWTRLEAKSLMGGFVLGLSDWKLFWTQTFSPPKGVRDQYTRRGNAYAWREWERLVELACSRVGDKCSSFAVMELHESGVPHIHALLGRGRGSVRWASGDNLAKLAADLEAMATERVGFSKVRVLNLDGGAAEYVTKYCTKGDNAWRFTE